MYDIQRLVLKAGEILCYLSIVIVPVALTYLCFKSGIYLEEVILPLALEVLIQTIMLTALAVCFNVVGSDLRPSMSDDDSPFFCEQSDDDSPVFCEHDVGNL